MKKLLFVVIIMGIVLIFFIFKNQQNKAVEQHSFQQERMTVAAFKPDTLEICSFNIQFLGSFKKRDDQALADIVKNYDIVVIQELVASPYDGTYPDGSAYTGDAEAAEFFDAMQGHGFSYLLSEEDTGTGDKNHLKSTATEWFVAFYKPHIVSTAVDVPHGFLAKDRSNNDDYERVPYAFPFRSANNTLDFVLISVHLQPGNRPAERERRAHELATISGWIQENSTVEKDFIILGDMNIYDADELAEITPQGFISLNDECRTTNTLSVSGRGEPYDHVMFNPRFSSEVDQAFDFYVINLVAAMQPYWISDSPYPGDPYDHNLFRQTYSDHFPVVFHLITPAQDDDGLHM